LEKRISDMTTDEIKLKQSTFEAVLTKIVTAPQPYPPPGRAIRNLVARCLISLYTIGETRTLFDTLQVFLKIVGDKSIDKDSSKVAAFSCIGDLMAVFGTQFMSFMADIIVVSIKAFKLNNPPLLRHHALIALKKSIKTARKAVTDASFKDVLKSMKSGLGDKSFPVQRAAAEVML
jgi:hypothetical protein